MLDPRQARLDAVLGKLEGVKPQRGGGYICQCPSHEDSTASLSVALGDTGVVMHDFGGCPTVKVLAAIGMKFPDLRYQGSQPKEDGPRKTKAIDRRGMEIEALMACDRLQGETEVLAKARHVRGWAAGALKALGVGWDGERFTLPVKDAEGKMHDVLRYDPYRTKWKMLAGEGRSRQPWPRPEDVETTGRSRGLYVVEGEGTAISLASVGLPVVALPGAIARATGDVRNPSRFEGVGWHRAWAKRFKGHGRIWLFPDSDEVGRTLMLTVHYDLEKEGLYPIFCDLSGPKGFDLGDLLVPAKDLELRRQGKALIEATARTATEQPHRMDEARFLAHEWLAWNRGMSPSAAPELTQDFEAFSW